MTADPSIDAALERARALLVSRQFEAAASIFEEVLAREPRHSRAWFLLGVAQAERGDVAAAKSSIDRSFELDSTQPPSHLLVHANVLLDLHEPGMAEARVREALRTAPDWPPGLVALGAALRQQGRLEEAMAAHRLAIARDPEYPRAHSALAACLSDAGRHGEAVDTLQRAAQRWPSNAGVRRDLADSHRRAARARHEAACVFDAIDEYRRALELENGIADWWNELGNAYSDAGFLREARDAYGQALKLDPSYHQVESNLLVNLHYDPAIGLEAIFDAHRAWAARHAELLERVPASRWPGRAPTDRLRVGFLSPALRSGPTGTFLAPLLAHLDRGRFEVHAFPVDGSADATTERLRGCCDAWHDVRGRTDAQIVDRVVGEGMHILVDLAGHAPGGRPLVLARKPAPVIATWLDYFDTTGLSAVDYLVGDPVSTPSGGRQRFAEEVVRIAPSRLCYAPPENAPSVAPPPAARNGYVTFGSFGRISKLAGPVIELWSEVMRRIPSARLLLKNGALVDERMREELARRFGRHGVDPGRIEMRTHSPHSRMLEEYGDIDVVLDSFPYNGGLTTCEALWMGVPVLTLAGASMISRQGAALLGAANLHSWVAESPQAYARLAVEQAAELAGLERLRRGMRERLLASPLLDAASFARNFGQALERMWERSGVRK